MTGHLIALIGDAGQRLLAGMRAAVVAMLETGNNIILDEMPISDAIMPSWRHALAQHTAYWVAFQALLDVIEAREDQRGHGRHLGNARGHFGFGMDSHFDLVIDATALTPDEQAAAIAQGVNAKDPTPHR
jgi:chloramphenicol 3-O phosphotransferase